MNGIEEALTYWGVTDVTGQFLKRHHHILSAQEVGYPSPHAEPVNKMRQQSERKKGSEGS